MNDDIKVLDKILLKKTIAKSRIFTVWDFFSLFPFIISCITGHGQIYFGSFVVVVNALKVILLFKRLKDVDNDSFFVLKSVIVGEYIEEGEDTKSYYKYFKYNNADGKIEQHVSKKVFDCYKNGDCFYLVFFKVNRKRQRNAECIFPCDRYSIDTEMKIGYVDCSYWDYTGQKSFENNNTLPHKTLTKRTEELTSKQKEEIMSVGKQVGALGKGMLISGIMLFVLFIAFIASLNNIVLILTVVSGAIFFLFLFKMIAITNANPEFDGVIYYMIKEELKNKEILQQKELENTFEKNFSEEMPAKKKKGIFHIIRNIIAAVIGIFSMVGVAFCIYEGITAENLTVLVTFFCAALTSLLMIITELKLLSPLYITGFLLGVVVDGYFIERNFVVGTFVLIFMLLALMPTVMTNMLTKK